MAPKSAKFKVAFTGTNSSGKTTMAMEVAARLKRDYHVLAELVSSQDRKISWKDEHFPHDPRGHFGMISNLVHAEVAAELKGDADIVVTDRSVLDLYAIAKTDFPNNSWVNGMEGYILSWLESYDLIFYLAPLAYQEDGKRPSDDFRMRTHATLRHLIDKYKPANLIEVDRPEAFKKILQLLDKEERKPIFAEAEKWQAIANELQATLIVKRQNWPATSDTDVFMLLENFQQYKNGKLIERANKVSKCYFGNQIVTSFMAVPAEIMKLDLYSLGDTLIYTPSK